MLRPLARLVRTRLRCHQAPEWAAHLGADWHRWLLDADLTDRLHRKQGRNIARWTLRGSSGRLAVFVKRHYTHSWWRSVLPFAQSDGASEWHHLRNAKELGMPVPRAVAFAEWSSWPGVLQSAIILQELDGMVALHEAIPLAAKRLSAAAFRRWKAGLIAELVRLTRILHDRRYFHRDLYLCHFFIPAGALDASVGDWKGRVVLIDFHRLSRQRLLPVFGRAKDLAQLLYSARLPGVTSRDLALFWRLYCEEEHRPMLRRLIEWKARRYELHNRKPA
jgi:Lipopolysaccharide kinase (Kdo/WaaP) family